MRDLEKDLELCNQATPGPWKCESSMHSEYAYEVCQDMFLDPIICSVINENDARFIAAAREGWPEAIQRAHKAEKELKKVYQELDELKNQLLSLLELRGMDTKKYV